MLRGRTASLKIINHNCGTRSLTYESHFKRAQSATDSIYSPKLKKAIHSPFGNEDEMQDLFLVEKNGDS